MSDLALTGRVMSDLALTGRIISDLAVGDLALNCPETDHNFDHDLDRRSYQNVKFSGFSIYEVKSRGLSLKKLI